MASKRYHSPPPPPPASESYHTLPEAAVVARRSEHAMRLLRSKGRGPRFVKVDGRLVVADSELRRWLAGEDTSTEAQSA
jgi:hypothetical protein